MLHLPPVHDLHLHTPMFALQMPFWLMALIGYAYYYIASNLP